jgi:TrmH family RNA methyltransferase
VIPWLRERHVRIVATSPGAETPYWDEPWRGPRAVVFGCERHGLPAAWLAAADDCVSIPAHGPVDSLNVAVAAGVVLCETARARTAAALPG